MSFLYDLIWIYLVLYSFYMICYCFLYDFVLFYVIFYIFVIIIIIIVIIMIIIILIIIIIVLEVLPHFSNVLCFLTNVFPDFERSTGNSKFRPEIPTTTDFSNVPFFC